MITIIEMERDFLRGQLAQSQAAHLAADIRAGAEAERDVIKEQFERLNQQRVLSVVHSEALPDKRPAPASSAPWWEFWNCD